MVECGDSAIVDVSTMTEGNDKDQKVAVVNFVNDSVSAHSDPHSSAAREFHAPVRPRVVRESPDRFNNPKLELAINARELLLSDSENVDTVTHVSRSSSRPRTASSKATAA